VQKSLRNQARPYAVSTIVYRLRAARQRNCCSIPGRNMSFFFTPKRPGRKPIPPSLVLNGYQGILPSAGKWPLLESDHSPPSTVMVTYEWNYTPPPSYVFKPWAGTTLHNREAKLWSRCLGERLIGFVSDPEDSFYCLRDRSVV
jgi:hypothetical protein